VRRKHFACAAVSGACANPRGQWRQCSKGRAAAGYQGRTNATELIRQRTLDMARTHGVPVKEFSEAREAAHAIRETAGMAA
jgi:hypothetical protein